MSCFFSWATNFVSDTEYLRRVKQKILLAYDGYGSHVTYRVLKLFRDNGIVVVSIPAHNSHALQPLDVDVFGSMEKAFRSCVSKRIVTRNNVVKNDIYTLCEFLRNYFLESMTLSNVIAGFNRSGLRCNESRGPDQS